MYFKFTVMKSTLTCGYLQTRRYGFLFNDDDEAALFGKKVMSQLYGSGQCPIILQQKLNDNLPPWRPRVGQENTSSEEWSQ